MAEIKRIAEDRLRYLSGEKGFNLIYLEKDYFLTALLYLIKDLEGIYFKGGTALNKIYLDHTRLSEDLDFTCKGKMSSIQIQILNMLEENRKIFPKQAFDRKTSDYLRLKVHYKSFFKKTDYIILDVNRKASLILDAARRKVPHFYESIPEFRVNTLNIEELVAEKVRALITRNQPRDYFDVYMILEKGYTVDLDLVKRKLSDINQEFNHERIFKNADKIYSNWERNIGQLTNKPVDFMKVIKKLQKEFRYKS
ncbi:MAG: nucleotidyl transferase AbiEii/AbiGii toxin family protein [Candidatus Hydrothermarchaeales archaeon]